MAETFYVNGELDPAPSSNDWVVIHIGAGEFTEDLVLSAGKIALIGKGKGITTLSPAVTISVTFASVSAILGLTAAAFEGLTIGGGFITTNDPTDFLFELGGAIGLQFIDCELTGLFFVATPGDSVAFVGRFLGCTIFINMLIFGIITDTGTAAFQALFFQDTKFLGAEVRGPAAGPVFGNFILDACECTDLRFVAAPAVANNSVVANNSSIANTGAAAIIYSTAADVGRFTNCVLIDLAGGVAVTHPGGGAGTLTYIGTRILNSGAPAASAHFLAGPGDIYVDLAVGPPVLTYLQDGSITPAGGAAWSAAIIVP